MTVKRKSSKVRRNQATPGTSRPRARGSPGAALAEASRQSAELLGALPNDSFPVELCDSLLRIGEAVEAAARPGHAELFDAGSAFREIASLIASGRAMADAGLAKAVRKALGVFATGAQPTTAAVKRVTSALGALLRDVRPDLGLTDRRVMVIDDDPVAQKAIAGALRNAGFIPVPVLHARHAMKRLQTQRPSLIVLDVEMPDMRGPELLRNIRRDSRLATVPVIFVSARKSLDVKLEALRGGADDYITKPFRPEELATRIAARLERGAVLQEMAIKDPLTGVATHRFFQEKLEEEIARHKRYQSVFSIACVDIDDLSKMNEKLGYDAGDRAVVRVGQFLRRALRRSDVVARLSGGEFGIILTHTDVKGARTILDRLRERLAQGKRSAPGIGVSGGIAGCPETTTDRRLLMASAREALETVKRRGKGRLLTAGELASADNGVVVAHPAEPMENAVLEGLSTSEVRTLNRVFIRDFSEHLKRLDGLDFDTALRDRVKSVGRVGHFLAGAGAIGGYPELSELGEAIETTTDRLLEAGAPPAGTHLALSEMQDQLQRIGAGLRAGTYDASDASKLDQRLRVSVARPDRDPRGGKDGNDADVLVVDDEKISQAAIGASLRRAGFSIREAYSGAEALEAVAAKVPDIIILDVMLPDLDGNEILARIRANPKLQLVPVVFVTAKKMLDDKLLALRTGADDYVTKPFSPEELVARVGSRLERARITRDMALRDGLTGLYNHRFFQERFGNEMDRRLRTRKNFCLSLIDIDDFKSINDRYGHRTGDDVLRTLASRLVSVLRSTDVVARYGGEEFAILLPETELIQGMEIVDRARANIVDSLNVRAASTGDLLRVTVSGGLAETTEESREQLFQRVDDALYKSKRAGKNRITVADPPSPEPIQT